VNAQLILLKQVEPPSFRPWRLLEIYTSSDGPRTRVCAGTWATEEEARAEIAEREQRK
jgi:hypothetical protein